jgi:hypothetical protein
MLKSVDRCYQIRVLNFPFVGLSHQSVILILECLMCLNFGFEVDQQFLFIFSELIDLRIQTVYLVGFLIATILLQFF